MAHSRIVAHLYFENPIVSAGGLGTVTQFLPGAMVAFGERVIALTPFHHAHSALVSAHRGGRFSVQTVGRTFKSGSFCGRYTSFIDKESPFPWIYVACDGCFTAKENPYAYRNPALLLRDALVFSAAAVQCLVDMQEQDPVVFHCHDWETAPAAIFAQQAAQRGRLHRCGSVLTLHNSFDSGLPLAERTFYFDTPPTQDTVLAASLPFFTGPLSTVSKTFAHELLHDPLQQTVFIPHLQKALQNRDIVGIPHGSFSSGKHSIFKELVADRDLLTVAKESALITARKLIADKKDPRSIGSLSEHTLHAPLLFMAGRFDLMQKGFDTIFHALKAIPRGTVQLFFCPSSGFDPSIDKRCAFFIECTKELSGDCVIWPFRITRREYMTILSGSHFMLMPSFFEPYGSVSEAFNAGTPVCARAAGGLRDQIIAIGSETATHNGKSVDAANGIVYREEFPLEASGGAWREMLSLAPSARMQSPLFSSIVQATQSALMTCAQVRAHNNDYMSMVKGALNSEYQNSWENAAESYSKLYSAALQKK